MSLFEANLKIHHNSCLMNMAWDVEGCPCTCPKYWPRKRKLSKLKVAQEPK